MSPSPTGPPADAPPDVGSLIGGRYQLVARIARGGMAEVWEAEDTVLTRPVAAKILLSHLAADDAFVARFRREAVAAARLSHPHIVAIYDTCASSHCEAIVMELVRGRTVRAALDDGGALSIREAIEVAAQTADALAHAHANGLIHRDVKPGNILLSDDGRVLVTDFGIAKAAEASSDLTEVGQVVGTAKYLSPEQVQGHPLDARSDVYSLGVVLYEMLCGRVPFAADNPTATALARLTTEPLRPRQVRAGIPRRVEEVVVKAMALRPEARYASAAELRSALLSLDLSRTEEHEHTAGIEIDPTPVPGTEVGFAQRERSWLVPAALIVVVAATLGILGVLIGRTEVGHNLFGGDPAPGAGGAAHPLTIGQPRSLDPASEDHPELLGRLVDGDPATTWYTQRYTTAAFGGLRKGVGVVLPLSSPADLQGLTIDSLSTGWHGTIYLADAPRSALADWGKPVAQVSGDDGSGGGRVSLGGHHAGAVLLWITDLGPGHRVTLGDVRLTR